MKRISALVGIFFLLILPSAALAQSSSCQSYQNQLCSSVGAGNATNTPGGTNGTTGAGGATGAANATNATGTAAANSTGTLPFTGLDLVLLVAGGGTLLVAGFLVRRVSRRLN
jgi:hypothetical protein